MTIRRQYSLPNCVLVLEGLTDAANFVGQSDVRPVLSILVNAECHIAGINPPLSGGREFIENLVKTVSSYAQEFLSGVHSYQSENRQSDWIELAKISSDVHRLKVYTKPNPEVLNGTKSQPKFTKAQSVPFQLDLTTVQLFDLVEAVDQLLADTQTLPDLGLQIVPVSKKNAISAKPLVERTAPVLLGGSSVAVAAIVFYLMPIPQVERPSTPTPTNPTQSQESPLNSQPPSTKSPTSANPQTSDLEVALNTAPEITEPQLLSALRRKVSEQIFQKLPKDTVFDESLIYRVGVDQKGAIVGYKAINSAAAENAQKTPLPSLLYIPVPGSNANSEPLAQFKVVFNTKGELEVAPWQQPVNNSNSHSEITDQNELDDLTQKLYDKINPLWVGTPPFDRNLVYRVTFTIDGTILDYEPINQAAFDYVRDTPLPNLYQPTKPTSTNTTTEESLGYFRVIFTPKGILQVSPW